MMEPEASEAKGGQKGLTSAATTNVIKTIRALAAKYTPMGMASSLTTRRPSESNLYFALLYSV